MVDTIIGSVFDVNIGDCIDVQDGVGMFSCVKHNLQDVGERCCTRKNLANCASTNKSMDVKAQASP